MLLGSLDRSPTLVWPSILDRRGWVRWGYHIEWFFLSSGLLWLVSMQLVRASCICCLYRCSSPLLMASFWEPMVATHQGAAVVFPLQGAAGTSFPCMCALSLVCLYVCLQMLDVEVFDIEFCFLFRRLVLPRRPGGNHCHWLIHLFRPASLHGACGRACPLDCVMCVGGGVRVCVCVCACVWVGV